MRCNECSASGRFRSGYYFKPGKEPNRPAGEYIKARTLLRYMQETYRARNKNSGSPTPSRFAPGDVGYIPHVQDNFGNVFIPGGWRRKEMLAAAAKGNNYFGSKPHLISDSQSFGVREVERSEQLCALHAKHVLTEISRNLKPIERDPKTGLFK